jgi:hypothetical protein
LRKVMAPSSIQYDEKLRVLTHTRLLHGVLMKILKP